jgi:8-oxo-dGTP pyrophosphatase MutT (NUDIX family)
MAAGTTETIQQATAIPFRWRNGKLEFCLITTTQEGHWAFPKGMIDPGETSSDTALKEAHEEAGLDGAIVGQPLGSYTYAKWGKDLNVTVRLMRVTRSAADWDESHLRQRRWATADEARKLIERAELRQLLDVAVERIRQNGFQ